MRAALAAVSLALTMPLLLGAASAGAAASADEAESPTVVAVYEVTATETSTGPDGGTESDGARGTLEIACAGAVCHVIAEPYRALLRPLALTAQPTDDEHAAIEGGLILGSASGACDGGIGEREVDLHADAATLTATLTQDALGWEDCGDGSEAYAHARQISWTGTLVSAPDCMFTAAGCRAAVAAAANGPATPSVLSALATPATAGTAPVQLLCAVLLTIVLLLLVAFPTALLNSAVEAGSDRLSAWRSSRRRTADAGASGGRRWSRSWWWAAVGVIAASLISSFVDPGFGFNPASGRVLLSILVSFAIDVVVGWSVVIWLMGRVNRGVTHSYAFRPLTLLVVVAAVVFTRVTGFEPGIVFGLVAGVSFGALAGVAPKARSALVSLGYAFALALAAWVLYGFVHASSGESFVMTLVVETLSATAIGGIAALPIALVPVRGLPGYAVWAWRRPVWAGCYAVGLLAFFVVLMPMPFSWGEVGWELGAWVAVYLAYAAVAAGAWLVLTRPWRRETSRDAPSAAVPAGADRLEG